MPDNPFANAFSPDRGGLTGFIGGLAGVPTQSQESGSATGDALHQLAELKAGGLNNQQALLKFFQTPAGHDYFTNAGPNGLKQLTDGLTSTDAPTASVHNVPEGGQLYTSQLGVNGGQPQLAATNPKSYPPTVLPPGNMAVDRSGKTIAENPSGNAEDPADVKSFKFYTSIAKLPPDEIKRLAALKADPSASSVTGDAVDKLVSDYGLDPRAGEAIKAGTLKIVPLKNQYGADTGDITVYDLSNPAAGAQLIHPSNQSAVSTPLPGSSPSSGAAVGALPATPAPAVSASSPSKVNDRPGFGNQKDMALGAGPVAGVLGAATKLSEAIDPRLIIDQGAQANDRETALGTLRSNLQSIGTIGGGMSSNKGLIEGYVHTYLDQGFFSSPHAQVQKLIRLNEVADKNISEETARTDDKSLPNEVRKQAAETVAGWQRVKSSLPPYDYLLEQESKIRAGTAGAPTVVGAGKAIAGAVSKGVTEVKKQGSELSGEVGLGNNQPNIDSMNDPKELLAIDPRTLSRENKIKYLRKIDSITGGKHSDSGSFQVAGDVVPFPLSKSNIAPNYTRVKNERSLFNGADKTNVVKFPGQG